MLTLHDDGLVRRFRSPRGLGIQAMGIRGQLLRPLEYSEVPAGPRMGKLRHLRQHVKVKALARAQIINCT
jgi:hypothetical protein